MDRYQALTVPQLFNIRFLGVEKNIGILIDVADDYEVSSLGIRYLLECSELKGVTYCN